MPNFLYECPKELAGDFVDSFIRQANVVEDTEHLLKTIKNAERYSIDAHDLGFMREVLRLLTPTTKDHYYLKLYRDFIDGRLNFKKDAVDATYTDEAIQVGKNQYIAQSPMGEIYGVFSAHDIDNISRWHDEFYLAKKKWSEENDERPTEEMEKPPVNEVQKKGQKLKDVISQGSKIADRDIEEFTDFALYDPVRERFEKDFSISLLDFSLAEQFQFISFIKDASEDKIKKTQAFVKDFGVEGFRTFLALEREGKQFGDQILKFAEQQKDAVGASTLFGKFTEFANGIQNAEKNIKELFPDQSENASEIVPQVQARLLEKGTDVLKRYVGSENSRLSPESISADL